MERVDGRLKVSGQARYAADTALDNLVYGALILSTVAKGRVREIDTTVLEQMPGVVAVLTPANAPRLPNASMHTQQNMRQGPIRMVTLLQEDTVWYVGQPIGVVIAATLFDEHVETAGLATRMLYEAPNIGTTHRLLDTQTLGYRLSARQGS